MERFLGFSLKKKIDEYVYKSLKSNVFSACSVGFFKIDNCKIENDCLFYGHTGKNKRAKEVNLSTYFDLASLTKPLVTSLSIMVLVEQGKIDLSDTLSRFFKRSLAGKQNITVYQLLTHSSGLPAHKEYYRKLFDLPEYQRKRQVVDWILSENLSFLPGTQSLYSDLGFILLGYIVERVSGFELDIFWKKEIAIPLKLENELIFNRNIKNNNKVFAKTGWCERTNTELCGMVHDDNCRALGGVAGHAGLFGTLHGVLKLCEEIMKRYQRCSGKIIKKPEILDLFFKKKNCSTWTLGFDTPSGPKSSSGEFFSEVSVGHLGFTGTSFWMDLQEGIGIVLLTNRVIYGDNLEPIRLLRPIIHNTIIKKLK